MMVLIFSIALSVTLSGVLFFFLQWRKEKNENALLFKNELELLQSQVNPHFLFNTLNSIYALALKKSDAAPGAILKLSSLMRYSLTESKRDKVPLETEIQQLQAYIDLQQLRLQRITEVVFHTNGITEHQAIAPVLLLPFVENAFKYGTHASTPSKIEISVTVQQSILEFHCSNHIFPNTEVMKESSGLGIANTRRRLELFYPNRHELKAAPNNEFFFVALRIEL
ncbi:MAG: sensor histidine kinase [Chitinophagales bacterium]